MFHFILQVLQEPLGPGFYAGCVGSGATGFVASKKNQQAIASV